MPGGGIVDSVVDHRHRLALGLPKGNDIRLAIWHDRGNQVVDTYFGGNRSA